LQWVKDLHLPLKCWIASKDGFNPPGAHST
jgi:hypothetical protein